LTTIGLTVEVQALRHAQNVFDDLVNRRAAQESSQDIPPLRTVRGLLREGLNVGTVSLSFAQRRNPARFDGLAEEISQHITDVVATARARRTLREADDEQLAAALATQMP